MPEAGDEGRHEEDRVEEGPEEGSDRVGGRAAFPERLEDETDAEAHQKTGHDGEQEGAGQADLHEGRTHRVHAEALVEARQAEDGTEDGAGSGAADDGSDDDRDRQERDGHGADAEVSDRGEGHEQKDGNEDAELTHVEDVLVDSFFSHS